MATYLILNLVFMSFVVLVLRIKPVKPSKHWIYTLVTVLALTGIFDSILIALNVFGYNSANILGVYIARAPIEDFAYAVLAVIIVPYIWNKLEQDK